MGPLLENLPTLHAASECDAEVVAWRLPAGPRLTVVAKIAFALEAGPIKRLLPRVDIVDRDRHYDRSPARSIEEASDLAPLIPGAEVIVVGHAYAPRGLATPSLPVQLQIARKGVVQLRKRLSVAGDRRDLQTAPLPFQRMPLIWERALRTPLNPVGIDPNAGLPNLVSPDHPGVAAAFAPIASNWPSRLARLGPVPRSVVDAEVLDLPAGFDFNYFRAAPDDQQLQTLKGDEWLALDGLHPLVPRLELRLPGAMIVARLVQPKGRPLKVQPLLPDRLVLDTDRQRGTLTYRAGIAIDWSTLAGHRIEIGVSKADETLRFPDHDDLTTLRGRSRTGMTALAPPPSVEPASQDPALPFPAGTPATRPSEAPRPADRALPFVEEPPAVVPAPAPVVAPPALIPAAPEAPSITQTPFAEDDPLLTTATVDHFLAGAVPVPFPGAIAAGEVVGSGATTGLPFTARAAIDEETTGGVVTKPERQGEVVPTLSDAALAISAFPWQVKPPQDVLVIVAKATFELIADGPAKIREEPEAIVGDLFVDDDLEKALVQASDFAVVKPEVDVVVRGTAYAPRGKATAMRVALRVRGAHGAIDKSVAVFGDRRWQGGALQLAPTAPETFDKIALSYERAFGGSGFDANPLGVGYRGTVDADGLRRLPNFEEIGKLIKSPSDAPAPAGLGPIHPLWRPRAGMLGTYDVEWFRTRWPYYPADFDFRYFQAAPPNQRLPRADGDEEYELVGLHAERGSLQGRLPKLRVRVFVVRTAAAGGDFIELPVRIDTLSFAPDEGTVSIVWRGILDVSDDDAPELAAIFGTVEPMAGPALTLEEARERYLEHIEPKVEPKLPLEDDAPAAATEEPSAEDAELARKIEEVVAKQQERIAAMRPPADPKEPAAPLPEPDPEAIAKALRKAGAKEEEIADVLQAFGPPKTEPPPPEDIDLRELVMKRLEAGQALSGLDLAGADLHDLDLTGQKLQRTNLSRAKLDGANLAGADASGANFSEASLVEANLEGAVLATADLTGADAARARMRGVMAAGLEAAELKAGGVDFSDAILAEAVLRDADLASAKLGGANLSGADLTGARLDRANFERATLTSARLYDASGRGASFDGADLASARFEGAVLTDSSFRGIVANESIWERADVSRSSFHGAILRESSFLKAVCREAVFEAADLTQSRLRKARMQGARLVRANLMEATCDRASFEGADLRGANLHAASLVRTVLKDAQLDKAIITYSDLDRRQPS